MEGAPGGGGLGGGQENVLDLSMSAVVTNMGDMGDGGDRTKRENLCREDSNQANFDNMTYRASIETGIVAFRQDSKPEL